MSTFVIEELGEGKDLSGTGGISIRLEWDTKNRAMPRQPWSYGVTQRTSRTDYPGGVVPTEQILGYSLDEFSLSGNLNDRYGGRDFASQQKNLLSTIAQRGNMARLTFVPPKTEAIGVTMEGIITNVRFDLRRAWDIDYTFTFSPHTSPTELIFSAGRAGSGGLEPFRERTGAESNFTPSRRRLNAKQLLDELKELLSDIDNLLGSLPAPIMILDIFSRVAAEAADMARLIGNIELTIQNRFLLNTEQEPGTPLQHLASLMRSYATVGKNIRTDMSALKSDTDLMYDSNAIDVMNFVDAVKGLAFTARLAVFTGTRNAREIEERALPDGKALYRPSVGESFYSISNRFYGTPHNWKAIADRNGICDFILTGEELLVIPDVTGV